MNCKYCGGHLKHRDYVKRVIKTKGGDKKFIKVERMICCDCGRLCRILPDNLSPYKHYDKDIIEGVREGFITPDTLGYENFPSEQTMELWKKSRK